jgi:hypothetical protein
MTHGFYPLNLVVWSNANHHLNPRYIISLKLVDNAVHATIDGNPNTYILNCTTRDDASREYQRLVTQINRSNDNGSMIRVSNEIATLTNEIRMLRERLNELEIQIMYMPGGQVAQVAENHFNQMVDRMDRDIREGAQM